MAEYTGKVERISERVGTGKKGPYVQFGFLVEGTWHNVFLNDKNEEMLRAIGDGDTVKIQTVKRGEYENVDTIEKVNPVFSSREEGPVPEKEKSPVTKAVERLDDKDFRITYLASRRDALEFVIASYTQGLIPLPTKKAEQADRLYEYMKRYALAFALDAWEVRPSDAVSLNAMVVESPKLTSTAKNLEE